MWTAVLCLVFYLIKYVIESSPSPSLFDMGLMAYGVGSLAVFVLIYGFDWS
jgi:hypothetical protein